MKVRMAFFLNLMIWTILLSQPHANAESLIQVKPQSLQKNLFSKANTNADRVSLFIYPEPAELIHTGVVLYYTPDLLDYFGNDVTLLANFIDDNIEVSNQVMVNSGLGLRRQVAAILPVSEEYNDALLYERDRSDIVNYAMIWAAGSNGRDPSTFSGSFANQLQSAVLDRLSASYASVIQRHYKRPNGSSGYYGWAGLANRATPYTVITPYENLQHNPLLLAHELGHSDGLFHHRGPGDANATQTNYAATCDGNYSLMHGAFIDYDDLFFSDPNHTHAVTGKECGEIGVNHAVAYLQNGIDNDWHETGFFIPNVSGNLAPETKGQVSLSLLSDEFVQGTSIQGEVFWQGLNPDDIASVTVIMDDYLQSSASSFADLPLLTIEYSGQPTSTFSFQLPADQIINQAQTFRLKLDYQHGVNIDQQANNATASIVAETTPRIGEFSFDAANIVTREGELINVIINRTNGADSQVTVGFEIADTSSAGANDVSFSESLVFAENETQKSLSVNIESDDLVEGDEVLSIRLINVNTGIIAQTDITIDDVVIGRLALPTNSYTVNEGESVNISVIRELGTDGQLSATLTSSSGTASQSDYNVSSQISISDSQQSAQISFSALSDSLSEASETVILTLSSTDVAISGDPDITITIVNVAPPSNSGGNPSPPSSASSSGGAASPFLGLLLLLIYAWKVSMRKIKTPKL
ncbi:Calx-beta domain-containing protein [Glaciecola sp. SC05]|uniref:Calx-beta domain-containing protein n=1 Tax=Glaciecola sp. SC05 TaxID=1987355 RepID=UPI003526F3FC